MFNAERLSCFEHTNLYLLLPSVSLSVCCVRNQLFVPYCFRQSARGNVNFMHICDPHRETDIPHIQPVDHHLVLICHSNETMIDMKCPLHGLNIPASRFKFYNSYFHS